MLAQRFSAGCPFEYNPAPQGATDMPHTHVNNVMHCVFSTKDREPFIAEGLRQHLWSYMGGIARQNRIKPITIGGMPDHVHLLLALPSDMAVAEAMRLIKGGSSKWVREKHMPKFNWQAGFGAFSVSASLIPNTILYIRTKKPITRRWTSKASTSSFSRNKESTTIPNTSGDQSSLRDLRCNAGLPALKRWANVTSPLRGAYIRGFLYWSPGNGKLETGNRLQPAAFSPSFSSSLTIVTSSSGFTGFSR
jgi:putative transposase